MSSDVRKIQMEKYIEQHSDVSVSELCEYFNISNMTVWRDLNSLEERGIIIRKHGRVMHVKALTNILEPKFASKQSLYNAEKEMIARYAVKHFVRDNDIIVLEGGTTIAHMVPHLKDSKITLLTNGLDVMNLAAEHCPKANLMASGGLFRQTSRTFVSSQAENFFQKINSDTFFFSASGLSLDSGITDPNPLEIEVKKRMAISSKQKVLLITSDKFGINSLAEVFPLDEIDHLVTDQNAPESMIEKLGKYKIEIHIAKE
ncbi:DeoR/GlpR family DNA-binding transcription regulator [Cohnella terricola]|uniref:DeoR/GlpR transcriptional regulator n=1 Tax=Cohnella terricola TaxID=1289167 RepID=A0A559JT42_9BACL|nr:DeoR/GlpR family DNA-binding transcription regulator [Cohnella terricola]TVY03046.1 DeoR/GlpR transcriptional regulator [Cohnella terricola]